ncbi:heavy-metal-associated domain-containing protein [Cytobacillus sp. IB215316]|uniref:heavy-metal-associated domain-containing protein n=1 Tax=Cytobacillus sp. IB215316 TaxID=3097354 RepID=UPI002A15D146|nr:cation transporter [Cytobacillus sp. IB215316]MDX8362450.1 cation transporter [Cytobacillus sp. IB215316]
MKTIIFNVEGMSCNHCVNSIEGGFDGIAGVCHAEVNLSGKTVEVKYEPTTVGVEKLKEIIEEAGYEVVG